MMSLFAFQGSLLEPYQDGTISNRITSPPPSIEIEDGPEYEVGVILDSKIVRNKLYYLPELFLKTSIANIQTNQVLNQRRLVTLVV